jgi:ferredoxin
MAGVLMHEVTIFPDGITVRVEDEDTLFRALSRAGLRYRVGCRRGGCGICKVRLLLGEVSYERPVADSVLSDDERVDGICVSCRAVPLTNIIIELQEGDRLRRVLGFGLAAAQSLLPPDAVSLELHQRPGLTGRTVPNAVPRVDEPKT